MSKPRRIQRKRTKGWRMPEGAVYVGRPTKWGNPFRVIPEPCHPRWAGPRWYVVETPDGRIWRPEDDGVPTLDGPAVIEGSRARAYWHAVDLFALHIGPMGSYEYSEEQLAELKSFAGRDLVCWCPLSRPCHADFLLELANEGGVS